MSGPPGWLAGADRSAPWPSLSVLVAGIGVSGFAAADALIGLGAVVTVVDAKNGPAERDRAGLLEILGAQVRLGPDAPQTVPAGVQLVVTSPGWSPGAPLLAGAAAAGIPIWGEVELAWRLRIDPAPPWLVITGTNGKTTAVRMLASMLTAAGLRAPAVGNVGTPLLEVITTKPAPAVLAVELSSFQLHWSSSIRAHSAAVLNVAPDHLDWHGSMADYAAAKGKAYQGNRVACVYNVADPVTEALVRAADVEPGCRAIGFTLGVPAPGMVGIVDDYLVDRAFVAERATAAAELATRADVVPAAPHNLANALAAAALARAYGVPPRAVRDGLHAFRLDPHRIALVATVAGVDYVDDSKATNPHAAAASIHAYDRVVWIAGGLAKGASFDELVSATKSRLRAAVLIGADRAVIADALARHAPDVPVVTVARTDTEVMDEVIAQASRLARPGDTVLLAPACASMDLYANYGERGDRFAAAVVRLRAARGG
ncbi:MAG TPA: UDP-N-acetylmuramoyl-L-alanine--D-glutamate ligase [Actinomycetes bacterium]|nr:UDP-N-acetylmuramoyl-L-alanine--D-glutamate ligase [Actinomycetes bacterium]